MVRLARGLPFTNPDHMDETEVLEITAAVGQLARSLRAFLGIALGAMVLLVIAQPLAHVTERLWLVSTAQLALKQAISATVGGLLAFVLTRIWQIVGSDLSLLQKQSEVMVRAVQRKARQKDEQRANDPALPQFKTPENYGRQLQ